MSPSYMWDYPWPSTNRDQDPHIFHCPHIAHGWSSQCHLWWRWCSPKWQSLRRKQQTSHSIARVVANRRNLDSAPARCSFQLVFLFFLLRSDDFFCAFFSVLADSNSYSLDRWFWGRERTFQKKMKEVLKLLRVAMNVHVFLLIASTKKGWANDNFEPWGWFFNPSKKGTGKPGV